MSDTDWAFVLILAGVLLGLSLALLLAGRWEQAPRLAPRRDADQDVPALPWTWD